MTSEERREQRYQRRKAKREEKRRLKNAEYDDFDKVFSYGHLYRSYKNCRKSVCWKASVQKYVTQAPLNVAKTYHQLQEGTYKTSGFYEFDLYERGKHRHIRSVTITERVVQRTLCDRALIPVLGRQFIYDNGASMKNKGYHFSRNRMIKHLRDHIRRYGNEGYILLFDFSKFFDNVSHEVLKRQLRSSFTDERIIRLAEHFIDAFGEKGMGLGSQISQVFALSSANELDHFVKEKLRIKGYGRYMDDGYLIHPSKEYLHYCLSEMKKVCERLGITLNEKKTQIVKISHGFSYLKARIFVTDTGRVIQKIYKRSVTRMRMKLKKLQKMYDRGDIPFDYIYQSWQSWSAYGAQYDAYNTIKTMASLYDDLFIQGGFWNAMVQDY